MRYSILLLCSLLLLSCSASKQKRNDNFAETFSSILNKYDLVGTLLVYDAQKGIFYSNDFTGAEKGNLPASTFKIPNTIIALETKVMHSDNSIIKWNGEDRHRQELEKDLTLREAFQASCVPCYQEIARKIGTTQMKSYLEKLKYNNMVVNDQTLDYFWLGGNSKITPFEQITFLENLYSQKLPITDATYAMMKKIMLLEKTDAHTLYGKTGWSNDQNINNGWFVGFVEKQNKTYYFALNVEPKDPENLTKFAAGRKQVVLEALSKMNIL